MILKVKVPEQDGWKYFEKIKRFQAIFIQNTKREDGDVLMVDLEFVDGDYKEALINTEAYLLNDNGIVIDTLLPRGI